jgi:hypothetical protein
MWTDEQTRRVVDALRKAGYVAWHRPGPVEKGPDGRYRLVADPQKPDAWPVAGPTSDVQPE